MNESDQKLLQAMIVYDQGDPARIQHFLKVYTFASLIGKEEKLDEETQHILETAAIVHDIGIHAAENQYGSSAGKYQEELGPSEAELMLWSLGYPDEVIGRVSYLVGHHHTYDNVDGEDYRILLEADALVNLQEENASTEAQLSAYEKIFRTESGKDIFLRLYPAAAQQLSADLMGYEMGF